MGRVIDRFVLSALAAAGLYLFFLNAWGSIPLACALAFVCAALGRFVATRIPRPRRATLAWARSELTRLAALPDREAEAALSALVRGRWPEEDFRLFAALKHPEATLSAGDILGAWKANRDAERLVIAATCPCEPRAALYARELTGPAVAVLDSRAIIRLLRTGMQADPQIRRQPVVPSLRRLFGRLCAARVSPRTALVGAALLAMYLMRGSLLALLAALALLARFAVALAQRRVGKRLFG